MNRKDRINKMRVFLKRTETSVVREAKRVLLRKFRFSCFSLLFDVRIFGLSEMILSGKRRKSWFGGGRIRSDAGSGRRCAGAHLISAGSRRISFPRRWTGFSTNQPSGSAYRTCLCPRLSDARRRIIVRRRLLSIICEWRPGFWGNQNRAYNPSLKVRGLLRKYCPSSFRLPDLSNAWR